jgi:hypothetical protein
MLKQRQFTIVLPDKQMRLNNYSKGTNSLIIFEGKKETVSYDGSPVTLKL